MPVNASRLLWILLAYTLLSLILTWPLVIHFTTHVPGDGIDDPSIAWNLWWVKHALVDQPQNPFACNWQFWPVGINLAFYTLTILNGMLSVPLQTVFGVVSAYNLLLLSSFVLSGLGGYLLCLEVLAQGGKEARKQEGKETKLALAPLLSPAAFLGGALYAFASAKMFYAALGQGNIASSQWVPFAALYILRAARPGGRWRDAVLGALFLTLQAYAELTYASFLLIFAALVAAWGLFSLARQRQPLTVQSAHHASYALTPHTLRLVFYVLRFTLLVFLFALAITPFLANMLPDLRAEGDFFTSGGGFADLFSADLAGYALPTQLHPLLGGIIRAWANDSAPRTDGSQFAVNKGQQIYLGYTATALALIGLWRGRRSKTTWFWAVSIALFFLLTLGPTLRIAGHDTGIPLPFALVAQLPFFKGNRYPSRYSVMLLMSVAPLVAAGLQIGVEGPLEPQASCGWANRRQRAPLWRALQIVTRARHLPSRREAAHFAICYLLFALLLVFEHLSIPLPLFDLTVPRLYDRVAAEPGDFALLELPLGWRNGARVAGKQDIVIMQQLWYQTRHGKRLLGGNTSRNPEFKFQYFSEDPTLARLIALTNAADLYEQHTALAAALASAPITEAEKTRARDWAAFTRIRYVMVHRDKLPAEAEEALAALLPVALVGEDGSLALYRVTPDLPVPQTFAVGEDQGRMALAEGWSPPEMTSQLARDRDLQGGGHVSVVYAQRREARLLLPLDVGPTQLRFYARSLAAGQMVTLILDGRTIGSQPLPQELSWLTFQVPADPGRPVLSDVRLRFSTLADVTQAAGPGPWPVGQTSASSPISLLVRSAGEETGDFAHIYANGVDLAPDHRGYNLVGLSQYDGRVLGVASFDTHADATAGARLASWVAGLPMGAIVAGAVRDEASMNLNEEAIQALRSVGIAFDLRGHFRWGHAFIGVVGAAPGTAAEAWGGIEPAQVSVGLPVSSPWVAAALAEVSYVK